MLYWLCYRNMHLGKNNQNCIFDQRHTDQTLNDFGKTIKPSVISTFAHLTTNEIDKEITSARSNFLQTTALSYLPRAKNIGSKLAYPSYSTQQIIRRNTLKPEKYTSHKKPDTLFSHMATTKLKKEFRQSTDQYFVPFRSFSIINETKNTTEHAISSSNSIKQTTYQLNQELEGFTSYIKAVSHLPNSFPEEKKKVKNKWITATFSQQEPLKNSQKFRLPPTITKLTNSNSGIYSTEEYSLISNKNKISSISEEQLKTFENDQSTTPSVNNPPNEDKLYSTTNFPLLNRTLITNKGESSPEAIRYNTTINARMKNQQRNFKTKYLPQNSKNTTNKYLSSTLSVKYTNQAIPESKLYYPILSQKNTMLSTKQLVSINSFYTSGASSYIHDNKTENALVKKSYARISHHKPTISLTPNTIKSFDYYSRFTPSFAAYDLKRDEIRTSLTPSRLQYKPLITQKPQKVVISQTSTSAFTHPFTRKFKTNKETNILLSPRILVKDTQHIPDIMLYWLCYKNMHLGENNQKFNFNQQQTESIMYNFCDVIKTTVASISTRDITSVAEKDLNLDIFKSHFTPSTLHLSTVSPRTHLSIGNPVFQGKHSKGQINNSQTPEKYINIRKKPSTQVPLRMKVHNFKSNYSGTKSNFLASPLLSQKSELHEGNFSNKKTGAYSSFTREPSDSSTIHLPSSNIHAHKFSTVNTFNHQPRYISKYFPINIKTKTSFSPYTVSNYNPKNTLKLHNIHKTRSHIHQNSSATKLYVPFIFRQQIATSSLISHVKYQQNSNIPKFSPELYTGIVAMKNSNPAIEFPSYIKRHPTESTSFYSRYKTTYNQNPNSSKFSNSLYTKKFSTQSGYTTTKLPRYIVQKSTNPTLLDSINTTTHKQSRNIANLSKLHLTNLPTVRNNNLTTQFSSYIKRRQPTNSISLDSIYKATYNQTPKSSEFFSRRHVTNLSIGPDGNLLTRFLSYVTREPAKSTSPDSISKTIYKESPDNSKFSTTTITRRHRGYSAVNFPSYITQQLTKSTSLDSVYKPKDVQNPNLISKSFTTLQKTTPIQKQSSHSLLKHISYLKTTQPLYSTSFNFNPKTSDPKMTDSIVKSSDIFHKMTSSLKETTTKAFIQHASEFLIKSTTNHSLHNLRFYQTPENIFKYLNKINTTNHSLEYSNFLNTKYFNPLPTKQPTFSTVYSSKSNNSFENYKIFKTILSTERDINQSTKRMKHHTVGQWTKPTSFTPVYITHTHIAHRQKQENIYNNFEKTHLATISSKQHYVSGIKPIPFITAKTTIQSTIHTPIPKNTPKLSKYPSVIIQGQQNRHSATKPLDYFRVSHPTVDTTDSLSNTEYSQKSDQVLRYTQKYSKNLFPTEPSTKLLDHFRNNIPTTSPSSKPETILENLAFYKSTFTKEVPAIEKFNYLSTRLPLYLRLKETIRRKSAEAESRRISVKRFATNVPEFIAENQNETAPIEHSPSELNVAQQSTGRLGRRRGGGGRGGRGRPGRGGGRKTPARIMGRPTKTKD